MTNARACEEAREPRCVCPCKGALHGSAHTREFFEREAVKLAGDRGAEWAANLKLADPRQFSLF